jgi:hypothetical protein
MIAAASELDANSALYEQMKRYMPNNSRKSSLRAYLFIPEAEHGKIYI